MMLHSLKHLSDELLINSYEKSKQLNLDNHFIHLLEEELLKRQLIKFKSGNKKSDTASSQPSLR